MWITYDGRTPPVLVHHRCHPDYLAGTFRELMPASACVWMVPTMVSPDEWGGSAPSRSWDAMSRARQSKEK